MDKMVVLLDNTLAEGIFQGLITTFGGGFMLVLSMLFLFSIFYLRFGVPMQIVLISGFVLLFNYSELFNIPTSIMYVVSLIFFITSAFITLRLMMSLISGVTR